MTTANKIPKMFNNDGAVKKVFARKLWNYVLREAGKEY